MSKGTIKISKNIQQSTSIKYVKKDFSFTFLFVIVCQQIFLNDFVIFALSGSFSADNLMQNLLNLSTPSIQQRGFIRRSIGGSSTLFNGIIMMNSNGRI